MRVSKLIDTEDFSRRLREKSIVVSERRLLLTNFAGSQQEADLTEPPNCDGVGRIRHFHRGDGSTWPENPLPIEPAARALGLGPLKEIRAQVFQNAACNWRCWYCFVPFANLNANENLSRWCTPADLVDRYMEIPNRPLMIDLTGGQPDLVPEWVLWTMEELQNRSLQNKVYLWSDDNLSGDYFWTYLTDKQRDYIKNYQMYGRVACFKGFDEDSFCFNTQAHGVEFEKQFTRFRRLMELGIDLYGYATFTTMNGSGIADKMRTFVDKLQSIHPALPLRTVPLEIKMYTPVKPRIKSGMDDALALQFEAIIAWQQELKQRFTPEEREMSICDVKLN